MIGQNEFDLFTWDWIPFVDPDSQLSNYLSSQVTTDPEVVGYNDANWCNDEYDKLYEQQHVELDVKKRHEIVQKMLEIFYEEAPYAVMYKADNLQAFRSDRWENFVRQPAETGPVLFTNTSPAYVQLVAKGGGSSSGTVCRPVGRSWGRRRRHRRRWVCGSAVDARKATTSANRP